MARKQERIIVLIQSVSFRKDAFAIMRARVYGQRGKDAHISVKGSLHGFSEIHPPFKLALDGSWSEHPKYGRQFKFTSWEPFLENEQDAIQFLSDNFDGFTKDLSTRLLSKVSFDKLFQVLASNTAVNDETILHARRAWSSIVAYRDVLNTLGDVEEIPPNVLNAILTHFGATRVRDILTRNPYELLVVSNVRFQHADKMAKRLGISDTDSRRLIGASLVILRETVQRGHLYLPHDVLCTALSKSLGIDIKDCILDMWKNALGIQVDGNDIYLSDWFTYESVSARILVRSACEKSLSIDVPAFIEEYEKTQNITLSEDQRAALVTLSENNALVLTGLPGTGKTTVIHAFVRMFDRAKISMQLMAPTGIAAKRLSSVTGRSASTIHRALAYDGMEWRFDETNKLPVDAVIVDEASMLDQEILYRLLIALRDDTIIVFVGDTAQLPSVGPGDVLHELTRCDSIPHVHLGKIFRQSHEGAIVYNAHRINRGETLDLSKKDSSSEFQYVPMSSETDTLNLIVRMAAKLKERGDNFQVLSPMHAGTIGVSSLNKRLQEALNPQKGQQEYQSGDVLFRVGDRVMVVQNDYRLGVYNGDVGKLIAIEKSHFLLRVYGVNGLLDEHIEIPVLQADLLKLAYAITVHKCQGSEYDTIILPIFWSQKRMLQRNLFYTAVTRAKKRVWLLGSEEAIQYAIRTANVRKRNTKLADRITRLTDLVDSLTESLAESV